MKININKEIVKDVAFRAVKTFIEAFVSALTVDALIGVTDFDTLKRVLISVLIAALAAGISAVWNSLKVPAMKLMDKLLEKVFPTSDELTAEIDKAFGGEDDGC